MGLGFQLLAGLVQIDSLGAAGQGVCGGRRTSRLPGPKPWHKSWQVASMSLTVNTR